MIFDQIITVLNHSFKNYYHFIKVFSGLKMHICGLAIFLNILASFQLYAQTQIGGIINEYTAIKSVEGDQAVTVASPDLFQAGDTVLLIQMKGLGIIAGEVITSEEPGEYGRPQNVNKSGNYEFLIIDRINNDTVVFTREFLEKDKYDAFETAQMVKARGYESATVTNTLTATPWDGEKGGIVALIVTNTLTLQADIDVTALGFRGGSPVTRTDNICIADAANVSDYTGFSFPGGSDKAGNKGEGPVSYYIDDNDNMFPLGNDFVQGFGRIATGGGGGNGRFSGGGGGGNWGFGGFGGAESEDCDPFRINEQDLGGVRGSSLQNQLMAFGQFQNRFWMGGGGGGSTQFGERNASSGGNGGGMVIIVANYIEGTDEYGIYAGGEDVTEIATAGAGGGGGGGTIVASVDNYLGTINMSVPGGKGGDVENEVMAGPGGGGGGGVVIHSEGSLPENVTTSLQGGGSGTNLIQADSYGTTIPSQGGTIENLDINLNGILFNGIRTERYVICEDTSPEFLEGTLPKGGKEPYIYQWLQKTSGAEWIAIPGADGLNYQPPSLNETTQYRRIVKDNDDLALQVIDTSNILTITVQPKILGNIISNSQTICESDTPARLDGDTPLQGGDGNFAYTWKKSTNSGNEWILPDNTYTGINYTPPPLFDSTLYVRVTTSGECIDTSNMVAVNVHPAILNNILEDDQTICFGDEALLVKGIQPVTGGTGTYTYAWEESTNGSWNPPGDGGNTSSYEPGVPSGTIRYRRIVESGECRDVSNPQQLFVLPVITMNTITGDQTICYLDQASLEGSFPEGGDNSYNYKWEVSAGNGLWESADDVNDNKDYLSPGLTDTTYFRRIVYSGRGDACKDTSNNFFIEFHPFSYAGIIESSDTICEGEDVDLTFTLSGMSPWNLTYTNGTDNFTITGLEDSENTITIGPETDDSTKYSYRIVSLTDRFDCPAIEENISGNATVMVYAYPIPDPGSGGEVCGPVFVLNAEPSYGKGLWEAESVVASFSPGPHTPNAEVTVEQYGTHKLIWSETNWKCKASAEVSLTFYEQPDEVNAGENQILQYVFETYMDARLPDGMPDATGEWELVEGSGTVFSNNDPGTMISDLEFGDNIFQWTVTNGVCNAVSDLVTITITDLQAPTGFSPNNSGLNDRFVIRGIENSSSNELTIFNRQGNVVYRTVNYQNDWEGKNQDGIPLPEDTYYYILSVDNKYSYKGFIILKR
jgi:gliding motility-associated-like protein